MRSLHAARLRGRAPREALGTAPTISASTAATALVVEPACSKICTPRARTPMPASRSVGCSPATIPRFRS